MFDRPAWVERLKWLVLPLRSERYDADRAFREIRPLVPRYTFPPTEDDIWAVYNLQTSFFFKKAGAAVLFLALSAFGVWYLAEPQYAFRFAAHLTLWALPWAWLLALLLILHFRLKEQAAMTLHALWLRWRAKPDAKL